jgi:RNA polymerase sigma factor (sigma-70 family)
MDAVLRHLHRAALLQGGAGLTDGQLLDRFLAVRDEDAFAALLRRHGPMVLAVCRRVLRDEHDADDAFQATFLVLARKAASLRGRPLLGGWLHEVAYRTSMKARTMMARRRARERLAGAKAAGATVPEEPEQELLALLDCELSRLPDKYRLPVILCELEGRPRREVARRLHLPEGTLSSRLAQARKLLAARLTRRAGTLTAGALAAAWAQETASASVPTPLLVATARAAARAAAGGSLAAGVVSTQVMLLTEGVLKAMLLSKLKAVWAVALIVLVGAGAVGLGYQTVSAQPGPGGGGSQSARRTSDELEELRLNIAALRKGQEILRERVGALEEEVKTLKARDNRPRGGTGGGGFGFSGMQGGMGGMGMGGMGMGGMGGAGMGGMPGMGGMSGSGMPGMGLMGGTGGLMGGPGGGGMGMMGGRGTGLGGGTGMMGGRGTGLSGGMGGFGGPGGVRRGQRGDTGGGSGAGGSGAGGLGGARGNPGTTDPNAQGQRRRQVRDPLADAEEALKALRQHPDDNRAADRLERALRQLKESRNTQGGPGSGR